MNTMALIVLTLVVAGWSGWQVWVWYNRCFIPEFILMQHVMQHRTIVLTKTHEKVVDQIILLTNRTRGYVQEIRVRRDKRMILYVAPFVGVVPALLVSGDWAAVLFTLGVIPIAFLMVSLMNSMKTAAMLQDIERCLQHHLERIQKSQGTELKKGRHV